MDASAFFRGKKITLTGLGLLGRGVGDARFLANAGAELIVTDLKREEELAPSVEALAGLPITFHLGGHSMEDFRGRDLVLVGPKTPLDSAYVAEARRASTHVSMSAAVAAKLAKEHGIPVVGVTGTRGKTTTTMMIAHILKEAGKTVGLGGNIRGISTLELLPKLGKDGVMVLELDSWQLQGFRDETLSPSVAVFTTFYPDHLDYYPDMDSYLADKAAVFLHQGPGDALVVGEQAHSMLLPKYANTLPKNTVVAKPFVGRLQVPGVHNQENAGCAREAARALGVADDVITKALASFEGMPDRLGLVREADGVSFYNDTTATTPEATLAALHALDPDGRKNIVLIMGGSDKGLDMGALLLEIPKHAKRVVMLAGSGTDRVLEFVPGASVFDDLPKAFAEAAHAASSGDIVLLSPAFASFGMFKNEYDRGDQYEALVRGL